MFAWFYMFVFWLSFTGGPRQESGTGAVSAAAVASTAIMREVDGRDFPLRVMT